jgi:hypothetical protein
MGYAHVIWIYNDALDGVPKGGDERDKLRAAVGEAILAVASQEGQQNVSAEVLNHGNAVNLCDTIHSSADRLYLWSRNCLRTLSELDDEDLEISKRLVDEELEKRAAKQRG